jgi:alpha-glucosidase (family GH31 glycosyl hydrolase)
LVHAITLKNATRSEKIKLNNEWVTVNPREWVARMNMTITVGLGSGTRESRIQQLMQLAGLQAQGVQVGIVTPKNLYNTGKRISEELGYKNTDEFWTDPAKQQQQPKEPAPEVQAAQIAAQGMTQAEDIKAETAKQRAQIEAGVELEKASKDEAVKRYEILVDAATKLLISRREQETEAMKVAADAEQRANEAVLTAHEAKGAADAANAREQPSPVDLSPMMEAIAALVEQLNAPRELVRDPKTGRAIGVRTVQ